ncbi:MAG: hypothetical protein U0M06_11680 [Clostridia bacterium]|nr:hypothetical protein [Clostridia bacterium]
MLKKQTVLIIVFSVIFVLLVVGYFAVVKPITDTEEPIDQTDAVTTEEGEQVAMGNDKVLVYSEIKDKNIQAITVKNEYGRYRVYRDNDGVPQIEGFEGIAFDEETMSSLMTSLGYPSAMYKISDPKSLAEYGLEPYTAEDGRTKYPATFELVTKTGERFSGVVGEKLVTGAGYYFLYDGRPDTVYVVDKSIASTVLSPVEALIAPMIVSPMTSNDYFLVHDYMLMKGEDVMVHIDYIEEEDRADSEFVTKTYNMLYPKDLTPEAEAVSNAMLGLFTANENDALEVVHLGVTDEALEEYDLTDNCYSLHYVHNDIENFILISPRQSDGTFYAASPMFDQIVKGTAEVFDFVTWDLFDWVEAPFFQMKISFITDITVESGDFKVTYDLEHIDDGVNSSGVDIGTSLVVRERGTSNKPDVTNFKQFYLTLLYSSYEGECTLMEEEMASYRGKGDSEADLILTIHTVSGRELRYRFFRYSERRSYVELNGAGEFYTLRTVPEKILADAKRVQANEPVTSLNKY